MQLALYDAIVRMDHSGLYIVFTPDGEKTVTDERYEAFDTACGQKIRKGVERHALTIRGYQCADRSDPLTSMWALAELVKEHFGIQVGLIEPG
jgi:hypothetical protein